MEINTADDIRDALAILENADATQYYKELAFKCVQRAQILQDLDLEFESRLEFVQKLVFLNEYEEAIASFPWLLNMCDRHPDRFSYPLVLWSFKWIIGAITFFHKVSQQQMDDLLLEFEKRFKDFGSGEKVILYYKMRQQAETGHIKEAMAYYTQYHASNDFGILDDCKACQPNNCIDVFQLAREYDKSLELSEMIFREKLSCHVVPHTTYPSAVVAAAMLERWNDAEVYFQNACDMLKPSETGQIKAFSDLVFYCALTGHHLKGREIIEQQLPFALKTQSDYFKSLFYIACHLFFDTIESDTVKLDVQTGGYNFVPAENNNTYGVQNLVNWFKENSLIHARLLDTRNQNSFYEDYVTYLTTFAAEKGKAIKRSKQ